MRFENPAHGVPESGRHSLRRRGGAFIDYAPSPVIVSNVFTRLLLTTLLLFGLAAAPVAAGEVCLAQVSAADCGCCPQDAATCCSASGQVPPPPPAQPQPRPTDFKLAFAPPQQPRPFHRVPIAEKPALRETLMIPVGAAPLIDLLCVRLI